MGEGGGVTTNDKLLANKIRLNISHGMVRDRKLMIRAPENASWYYEVDDYGWNYRASEISCALGLSQFKRIKKIIEKRQIIATFYKKYLKKSKFLSLPKIDSKKYSQGWHLFQLYIDFNKLNKSKEDFLQYLKKYSIGSQVHYIPLVYQPYYTKNPEKKYLIGALKFYENTISIPMYTSLKERDVKYISEVINSFFNNLKK